MSSEKDKELKEKRKAYMTKANPSTVEDNLDGEKSETDYFKEGQWKPSWTYLEFNGDACLANVLGKPNEGFYAPAGTMLLLGAQLPEMTVLKYGGYIPEGTSFPGGVMVPMHARMVNLLPQESSKPSGKAASESLCSVQ
ncbi:hypothetical protein L204_104939 [Cryptococcus depauperatus]|nr:hypothetical protein L204_05448 [Cryptococcus depauperatus CBS 7855]